MMCSLCTDEVYIHLCVHTAVCTLHQHMSYQFSINQMHIISQTHKIHTHTHTSVLGSVEAGCFFKTFKGNKKLCLGVQPQADCILGSDQTTAREMNVPHAWVCVFHGKACGGSDLVSYLPNVLISKHIGCSQFSYEEKRENLRLNLCVCEQGEWVRERTGNYLVFTQCFDWNWDFFFFFYRLLIWNFW